MKKKVTSKVKKKVKALKTKKSEEADILPTQADDEMTLIYTPVIVASRTARPDGVRSDLQELKVKFVREAREAAARHGLRLDTRVYFTLNAIDKES